MSIWKFRQLMYPTQHSLHASWVCRHCRHSPHWTTALSSIRLEDNLMSSECLKSICEPVITPKINVYNAMEKCNAVWEHLSLFLFFFLRASLPFIKQKDEDNKANIKRRKRMKKENYKNNMNSVKTNRSIKHSFFKPSCCSYHAWIPSFS